MLKTFIAMILMVLVPKAASSHALIPHDTLQNEQQADENDDNGPTRVGYAIITPASDTAAPLTVFESFGFKLGADTIQAGVQPAVMSTGGQLFANTSVHLLRNLGVAMANMGSAEARVSFTLRRDDGIALGSKTIFIPPFWQTSKFVTELFADNATLPEDITGSLSFTSTSPLAVVGLRFRGNIFSTEPVVNTLDSNSVPVRSPGVGGKGAVILPQFAVGGGWSTEFVIMNPGTTTLFVRLDLFGPDGSPLTVTMNGTTSNSFLNLRIFPGGVLTLAPRDINGNSRF